MINYSEISISEKVHLRIRDKTIFILEKDKYAVNGYDVVEITKDELKSIYDLVFSDNNKENEGG